MWGIGHTLHGYLYGWSIGLSLGTTNATHALFAAISRRDQSPASGFGSRGQARQAEEGGQGVEGAVAVPAGEDAVIFCQRSEAGLVRLLVRHEWQHLRLRDEDRGRLVSGGGRAAGLDCGRRAAGGDTGC